MLPLMPQMFCCLSNLNNAHSWQTRAETVAVLLSYALRDREVLFPETVHAAASVSSNGTAVAFGQHKLDSVQSSYSKAAACNDV